MKVTSSLARSHMEVAPTTDHARPESTHMQKRSNRPPSIRTILRRDKTTVRRARHYGVASESVPPRVESLVLDTTHLGDPRSTIIHRVGAPGLDDPRVSAGDLVVADRAVRPEDGDLVIAVIAGEKVIRLFRVSGGREYLLAGGEYCDVEVTGDARVKILASVVSVIPVVREP